MREEMRTFGYLCPKCKKTVMAARSVFALEAAGAEVECSCGSSALRAVSDGEKYRIQVPCGLCGETHAATCTPSQVLDGASALACTKTKQFCCFIGPEGAVEKQLQELSILAEKEQRGDGSEAFLDSVIMYGTEGHCLPLRWPHVRLRKPGDSYGNPPFCCGFDLQRLRRKTPYPCRYRPGFGQPLLSNEAGPAWP